MDFLGERDWGNTFDVLRSNGFDDIRFQKFVDSITEVCALGLCKLSLAWDFLWECRIRWYVYAMFGTRYSYNFANRQREAVGKFRQ